MGKQIKTLKDFKEFTKDYDDNSPIFLGTFNGCCDTYTLADHVFSCKYEEIENDFFGTRGKMDKRILGNDFLGKDVIYIGSMFHRHVDNMEIDTKDNSNQPIELINGENGDHNLFWKTNGFKEIKEGVWSYTSDEEGNKYSIEYNAQTKMIKVWKDNNINGFEFCGECIGLEDYFDIMKACKIQKSWRIG